MTHTRLSTAADGPIDDDLPLSAAIGIRLEDNVRHNLDHRTQRAGVTYALWRSTSTASDPPDGDSTIVGPSVEIAGSVAPLAEAIGLRLSSPPTMPIVLDLGEFPLSAQATGLRVVVGCVTETADVYLAAVATIGPAARPQNPSGDLVIDENGIATMNAAMNAVTVGTTAPSGTQLCKPVVLTVDLGGARTEMLARSDDGDGSGLYCRVYLAILSAPGAQGPKIGITGGILDGGRMLATGVAFSSLGINPGPFHQWVELVDTGTAAASSDTYLPRFRGVIQVRPALVADVTSQGVLVIHPPIERTDAFDTSAVPEVYLWTCGVIALHAVSIAETTA